MEITIGILVSIVVILAYLAYDGRQKAAQRLKKILEKEEINNLLSQENSSIREEYKDVIDIDTFVAERQNLIVSLDQSIEDIRKLYSDKRSILKSLEDEINIYESKLDDISYGLYEPIYNYDTSEEYKNRLEAIRFQLKKFISEDKAVFCPTEWTVSGSRTEGKRMIKQASKLMLRAFNGESDSLIAKVNWNNIETMKQRMNKAYETINKLGAVNNITITKTYYDLKVIELKLEFEFEEKRHIEKEEQRMIRDQMREEERALKEAEQAQRKAEEEEARYQKALTKAHQELSQATGEQFNKLEYKISTLELALIEAQKLKERAISMAQLTKSGHVYIISNIGSFGEDVFKIGMTRRLEPMDRVRELGDASVPFGFDVHALVYCDNAPDLENKLHKKFYDRRLNLINNRREFFKVDIEEIQWAVKEFGLDLTLTKLAEAKEYRESDSIRKLKHATKVEILLDPESKFPSSI